MLSDVGHVEFAGAVILELDRDIRRFLKWRWPSVDDDDIVQDTLCALCKIQRRGWVIPSSEDLFALARTIAHRLAIRDLERVQLNNRHRPMGIPWIPQAPGNTSGSAFRFSEDSLGLERIAEEPDYFRTQFSPEMERALHALTRQQRTVLWMIFIDQRTENEVAADLGIGRGSVTQHKARALTTLREKLSPAA